MAKLPKGWTSDKTHIYIPIPKIRGMLMNACYNDDTNEFTYTLTKTSKKEKQNDYL